MPQPKQVIFVITDTQRADMLGCYGNPAMKTPCLDKLAAEGIRFDQAYTCQPVCGPARSAIFTGTWPHSNGSWANNMPLGDNIVTIGQRIHDHGIHCGYIGKWHLDGSDYFGLGRCPKGWDPKYWYDMRCYLEELTPEDRIRSRDVHTNNDPSLQAEFTYAHRCSNRAIDFLRNHRNEDFFLVVSYDEPHHPYLCPKPFSRMYEGYQWPRTANHIDSLDHKPDHHRAWASSVSAPEANLDAFQREMAWFLGCNSFVDHEIGRVLQTAAEAAPNALVIYTSDHGDALYSHRITNKGPAAYDEVVRVPLIVRWPGQAPANAACSRLASHIDLAPTIMQALSLPVAQAFEGQSMLAAIRDPAVGFNNEIFIEFGRYEVDHDGFGGFQPMRAVCDGHYKLVINLLSSDELYDMQKDSEELVNLIDSPSHCTIRDDLHNRLLDWMNRTRDPFRGYYWERRPWRTDARPADWGYTRMTRQRQNDEYEPRQLDYATGLPMREAVRLK